MTSYRNMSPEQKERHNADIRDRRKRQRADPAWRSIYHERDRNYDKAKKAAADRERNQREDVKARRRERDRARYAEKLRDDPVYREKQRERFAKHYDENKDYYIARGAERARRSRRSFHLLTKEQQDQVVGFYVLARQLTLATGVPHEVDHIEPLRGKTSCGLHVPWNLQVVTRKANRAKGNRLP